MILSFGIFLVKISKKKKKCPEENEKNHTIKHYPNNISHVDTLHVKIFTVYVKRILSFFQFWLELIYLQLIVVCIFDTYTAQFSVLD